MHVAAALAAHVDALAVAVHGHGLLGGGLEALLHVAHVVDAAGGGVVDEDARLLDAVDAAPVLQDPHGLRLGERHPEHLVRAVLDAVAVERAGRPPGEVHPAVVDQHRHDVLLARRGGLDHPVRGRVRLLQHDQLAQGVHPAGDVRGADRHARHPIAVGHLGGQQLALVAGPPVDGDEVGVAADAGVDVGVVGLDAAHVRLAGGRLAQVAAGSRGGVVLDHPAGL